MRAPSSSKPSNPHDLDGPAILIALALIVHAVVSAVFAYL